MSVIFAFLQWLTSLPHHSSYEEKRNDPVWGTKIDLDRLWQWKVRSVTIFLWPTKDSYPRTGLCAGSAASTSPVLLQQMPMHSVSGTGELPHSTTSPAGPMSKKKHEMMINIQFSLKSWLKKHVKAFFCAFKYNTGNQGLQNIHCSIKKQRYLYN